MLRSHSSKYKFNFDEFNREILRRLDIQQEAEQLGVRFTGSPSNGWQPCHAIDREDKNPSAAICVDSCHEAAGRYKDHGGTGESFSFWELAARLGTFSDWKEARNHYAEKTGVDLSDFTENNQPQKTRHPMDQVEIVEEFGSRHEEQLELWSKTKPPITPEAIQDAGAIVVRWPKQAPKPFLCIGFPSWDDQQEENGLILYRVDGENFPGYQGSQPKKTIITNGSSDGWVILGGWERFHKAIVVWKVEGIPDALALYPHLPKGHVVVTNICGAMSAADRFPDLFQGKKVYAIGDADQPGQKGVEKFAQNILEVAESVQILKLPYPVVEKHGMDVRDFFLEGHSFEELLNLAEEAPAVQHQWPPLNPICAPALPQFPVEVLPDDLRNWVLAESEATQTPPDLAGLLALSVCAAALAKKVEVIGAFDWREPVNLFVAVLLEPANRKSGVFRHATAPLRKYERNLVDEMRPEYMEAIQTRKQKEKRLKILEDKAARSGDPEKFQEALQLGMELQETPVPVLPSLIVDDVTSEKLAMMLNDQDGRIASMSPEGGVFDLMAGKYSKTGSTEFEIYLKGHAGDDHKVDRVGRPSFYLSSPAITMGLAIQPAVIAGIADKSAFRGKGLLGRFLYAKPESWIGRRRVDANPVPAIIKEKYQNLIQRLAQYPVPPVGEYGEVGNPIRLSAEAFEFKIQWAKEVEDSLDDEGQMELIRDWGGKLVGLTLRLAGILHCVRWSESSEPWNLEISRETMEAAIAIARYAIPHAEATLDLMHAQEDSVKGHAEQIWRRIQRKGWSRFYQRDLYRSVRRKLGSVEVMKDSLKVLVEHGYLRIVSQKGSSIEYEVNPEALKDDRSPVPYPTNPVTTVTGQEEEPLTVTNVTTFSKPGNECTSDDNDWGYV